MRNQTCEILSILFILGVILFPLEFCFFFLDSHMKFKGLLAW